MAKHTLRARILMTNIITLLLVIIIFLAVFISSLMRINDISLENAEVLGKAAADMSSAALEEQITPSTMKLVEDVATIIDSNLVRIVSVSQFLASSVTQIYTHPEYYNPRVLPRIAPGGMSDNGIPFINTSEGVSFERIRTEANLVSNCADTMERLEALTSNIASAFVAGKAGYTITLDNVPAPSVDSAPSKQNWFNLAELSGNTIWTDIFNDVRGRGLMIGCVAPFYDVFSGRKAFKGVAGCYASVTNFEKIISSANIWEHDGKTYVFLLDSTGKKLFSSDGTGARLDESGAIIYENYIEDSRFKNFAERMTAGESGFLTLSDQSDKTNYVAYYPLKASNLGWSLGVYFDGEEITLQMSKLKSNVAQFTARSQRSMDSTAVSMIGFTILAVALVSAAALIVSFRFAHDITRPIVELGDAVSLVSGGNIRMAQEITSDTEELDRLAASFNAMMRRLDSYVSNLADVTAEKERFSAQINVASSIQFSMLPRKFPPQHGRNNIFDLYAMMRPAKEVGGDFYDFFFVDNSHFVILVGDVASVGVPAALFMSISKTLIRAYLKQGYSLDLALSEVNRALCDNNEQDIFVTVWVGMVDLNEKKLQFVNSGHFSPYIKTSANTFMPIQTPSDPPLGFMEDSVYHCKETNINKGNVLFLYTDGVINAIGKNGEQYEARRLKTMLEANAAKAMRELLSVVKNSIVEFSKSREQSDDITMLGFKLL